MREGVYHKKTEQNLLFRHLPSSALLRNTHSDQPRTVAPVSTASEGIWYGCRNQRTGHTLGRLYEQPQYNAIQEAQGENPAWPGDLSVPSPFVFRTLPYLFLITSSCP
jgi:hypothetical protein